MTNDNESGVDPRRAMLEKILAHAATDGFSPTALRQVGAFDWFPSGFADIMTYWTHLDDVETELRLKTMNLAVLSVRDRIRTGVLTRLAIIRPNKEIARKALATAALPQFVGLGATIMWNWADVVWRAAGDTSTDINYYTKRGILAGVMSATLVTWYGDDSEDEHTTVAFLDARLANVLEFEKLKAKVKNTCSGKTQ